MSIFALLFTCLTLVLQQAEPSNIKYKVVMSLSFQIIS